ncbi:unnamed protein product [Phyllotreta striolata]|uniref:Uncharacterized protein n=1 Tax=Phyllotreta striolata TaxID=444603 RepID=A0A9N9XQT3_PHYSR|nr:unnamed protein product [Phyllotreta striolata]
MEKKTRTKIFWALAMIVNFIFGIIGVLICTLKIHHSEDEEKQAGFFKLSIFFAACNLILSSVLLVALLKRDQKYAFLYALLIFISLFAATMHVESHSSHNYTYLIIFIVFAVVCFLWFTTYAATQYWKYWSKNHIAELYDQDSPIDDV